MQKFNLFILTPGGVAYQGDVESLVAPGTNGFFGVLASHAPMIAATLPGVFKIKEDKEIFFAVGNGMLEVSSGNVNFLVDHAERVDDATSAKNKALELAAGSN